MRAIASVGVVLCLAMTSFSIYLGIAEHAFNRHPAADVAFVLPTGRGRQVVCLEYEHTSTTISAARKVPCESGRHSAS